MSATAVEHAIADTLRRLEADYELLITGSGPDRVRRALVEAVLQVSFPRLTPKEHAAVLAALRLLCSGYRLDDDEFEPCVGLSRAELARTLRKLDPLDDSAGVQRRRRAPAL
jgi:hypothetical protein